MPPPVLSRQRLGEYRRVARTLSSQLAGAQREGLPLTPSDLRRAPVPREQNAAPVYVQIHADFARAGDGDAAEATLSALLRPERTGKDRGAAAALLRRWDAQMRLANHAAGLSYCDFGVRWEDAPDIAFPYFPTLRRLARMRAAQAVLASDAKKPAEAFRALVRGARIARHAGQEPIFIALLVQMTIDAIADRWFVDVLLAHQEDRNAIKAARATLAAFSTTPDLRYVLRGELLFARSSFAKARTNSNVFAAIIAQGTPLAGVRPDTAARGVILDAWEARHLAAWRRIFRELAAGRGDLSAAEKTLRAAGAEAVREANRPGGELLAQHLPGYGNAAPFAMGAVARRVLRQTLVGMLEHRLRTGDLPMSVADMTPPHRSTRLPANCCNTGAPGGAASPCIVSAQTAPMMAAIPEPAISALSTSLSAIADSRLRYQGKTSIVTCPLSVTGRVTRWSRSKDMPMRGLPLAAWTRTTRSAPSHTTTPSCTLHSIMLPSDSMVDSVRTKGSSSASIRSCGRDSSSVKPVSRTASTSLALPSPPRTRRRTSASRRASRTIPVIIGGTGSSHRPVWRRRIPNADSIKLRVWLLRQETMGCRQRVLVHLIVARLDVNNDSLALVA